MSLSNCYLSRLSAIPAQTAERRALHGECHRGLRRRVVSLRLNYRYPVLFPPRVCSERRPDGNPRLS